MKKYCKIAAPRNLFDLVYLQIPDEYRNDSPTIGVNEQCVLADSGTSNEMILLFGWPIGLKLINDSKVFLAEFLEWV